MSAPAPDGAGRPLFGIAFSGDSVAELEDAIAAGPEGAQGVRMLVTANLDHVVELQGNPALREAYLHSWRRTIDGAPVLLYGMARGSGVTHRITGADLVPTLLPRLDPARHRLSFVVATDEIARRLRTWAVEQGFPADGVLFDVPPFGFEHDRVYSEALAARIRATGTTHLFFGVGCPKSEVWIDRHRDRLGDLYALAVGAALGFFVGVERRAPRLVSTLGFEWLWRVAREPRRLAPRYLVRSWGFVGAVVDDLRRR
jgi:N-acetylglucosaminyldiphosphoundecaprenol N-acetyl-beta-D-mannosaminyltransferase